MDERTSSRRQRGWDDRGAYGLNTHMRIDEVIKPQAPKTPEQQRVATLQQGLEVAKRRLDTERQRQKVQRAQKQLARALNVAASSKNTTA